MKTFVEKYIDRIVETELDLEFPFYDTEDSDRNEVMIPYNLLNFTEAPSIDINRMITHLEALKEKGANRVYIADHCDHHGYYIYGVELKEI